LPGEKARGSERRVVLDFSNAKLGAEAQAPIGIEDGLLKQIRMGQFTARTARVVLDLASVTGHHVAMLDDPPRIVVDIEGKPSTQSARAERHDAGTALKEAAAPQAPPPVESARAAEPAHATERARPAEQRRSVADK